MCNLEAAEIGSALPGLTGRGCNDDQLLEVFVVIKIELSVHLSYPHYLHLKLNCSARYSRGLELKEDDGCSNNEPKLYC